MNALPDNKTRTPVRPASSAGALVHAPAKIYTVAGLAPEMPESFPCVLHWRDWHMPERNAWATWPPASPPNYGGQTGMSRWRIDRHQNLCIETTLATAEQFHAFVFFNWGCRPAGQSKVTETTEADGGKFVIEDSSL